jgi:hypothetical protein
MKPIVALVAVFTLFLAACGSDAKAPSASANAKGRENVQTQNSSFAPPEPKNFTEYHNYMKAQELYDSPSTIIWCTSSWGNASAPMFTVPIAGKLTSSSVSLFPSSQVKVWNDSNTNNHGYNPELPSVDSMYHGNPPAYRYGFTPGGQYVDFSGMEVFCTTALTEFQRQSTEVVTKVDAGVGAAQTKAENALKECQADDDAKNTSSELCAGAQKALEDALAGG